MIILTDPEGKQLGFKSKTEAANRLGRNYKAVHQAVELGYYVSHRITKIKYKAHDTERNRSAQ